MATIRVLVPSRPIIATIPFHAAIAIAMLAPATSDASPLLDMAGTYQVAGTFCGRSRVPDEWECLPGINACLSIEPISKESARVTVTTSIADGGEACLASGIARVRSNKLVVRKEDLDQSEWVDAKNGTAAIRISVTKNSIGIEGSSDLCGVRPLGVIFKKEDRITTFPLECPGAPRRNLATAQPKATEKKNKKTKMPSTGPVPLHAYSEGDCNLAKSIVVPGFETED